jgi:hypothetical protein
VDPAWMDRRRAYAACAVALIESHCEEDVRRL